MRRWSPFLILLLAPLVPLWRAVFLGEAIGAFDQIRQMAPWNGPKPDVPWDVLQADSVLQFFPWRTMVLDAWGRGQLPLWNNYELAGTPLLANSQSGGFYPLHICLGILQFPPALAITLLAWFHLAWAGMGVYLLTRRLGGGRLGAAVGGSSFSLSAFMVGWTPLASVITTVCWIPWVLACIAGLFLEQPALPLRRRKTTVALAASTGMMLLGGHLQFAAYGLMAAIAMVVAMAWTTPGSTKNEETNALSKSDLSSHEDDRQGLAARIKNRKLAGLCACALGLALGVILSLPQLLPVLAYGKFSHRQNTPSSEGYAKYVAASIKPFELAALGQATALGSPRAPVTVGNETISEYWPALVKRGANFQESAIGVGPLVFALLFVVPWKDRRTWGVAAIGIFGLLLALGTFANLPLYFAVPGWSATGSPGRAGALFVLSGCVLAGLGASRLALEEKPKKLLFPIFAGIASGLILLSLGGVFAPSTNGNADLVQALQAKATASLLPVLLVSIALSIAALCLIGSWGLRKYRYASLLMPPLICWLSFGSNLIMTGKPLERMLAVPANERVAFLNSAWEILIASHALAPPNTASLSQIHEIGGYDSLLHRDTVALLSQIDGVDPAAEANGNMMFFKAPGNTLNSTVQLANAGVTRVVSNESGASGPTDPKANAQHLGWINIQGPGRFSLSGGNVQLIEEGYDRLTLSTQGPPGMLVVRDRMMPGWTAEVDGKPTVVPEAIWRQVKLDSAGAHRVTFRYAPPGLRIGLLLGGIGWLLLLAAAISVFRRQDSESSTDKLQ